MMTPAIAAELLGIAAAFDRRKVGDADAIAWCDALRDLDPRDCADAIRAHFRESTDYLMPVHVRQGVRKIRADRVRAVPTSALEPHDVDPDDLSRYQRERLRLVRSIADGQPIPVPPELPSRPVAELLATAARHFPSIPKESA